VLAKALAHFPWDDQETFRWLCRHWGKNPDDFSVEVKDHVPDPDSSEAHQDVIVVYLPNGNARRYCPDYGKFWTLKFGTDLKVGYFTPEDASRRGALCGRKGMATPDEGIETESCPS
jgi:hypothetical protein